MGPSAIRQDIEHLAGALEHRGSNTENERAAAEYIRRRFNERCADVEIDAFDSPESYFSLFAAYYGEYLFVAILAFWWPYIAFIYGFLVFMAYLAELAGFSLAGRLLPQYESQNVVARRLANRPRRLFIITAHYDSPKNSLLSQSGPASVLRYVHLFLVICMAATLTSCAMQAGNLFDGLYRPDLMIRWAAVGALTCAAAYMLYNEFTADYQRGANDNASGVAALLELDRRLDALPLERADVWLVATGSMEGWLNGMRRLFQEHDFEPGETYFLNLNQVGADELRYVTGEGLLHLFKSSRAMLKIAQDAAPRFDAAPLRQRGLPSDALIPLARGFPTLGLTSVDPPRKASEGESATFPDRDGFLGVNDVTIARAADFAEAILRALDAETSVETA